MDISLTNYMYEQLDLVDLSFKRYMYNKLPWKVRGFSLKTRNHANGILSHINNIIINDLRFVKQI